MESPPKTASKRLMTPTKVSSPWQGSVMGTTSEFSLTTSCDRSALLCTSVIASQQAAAQQTEIRKALASIQETLGRVGAEFATDHQRIAALQERLEEDRFHLAVLGQFKRGKSTLLNALLGEAVLPSSVVPLTSIPTFIRRGPVRRVRVVHRGGRTGAELSSNNPDELAAFLTQFVTEGANPNNIKQVSHVEFFHPAPILHNGVVLIDTPGIGSTFRHNTEATLNLLTECDAALFLASADPPLTEVEVDFLKKVQAKVARVFFILNKVDYLSENDRRVALDFFREVLVRHGGAANATPIFATSAIQGLEAKRTQDAALWSKSGLAEVEKHLLGFLATGKTRALQEAICRKVHDVVADSLLRLRLTIRSLQMPLADLEERVRTFERKLKDVEQQRVATGDLLEGDRKRLASVVESEAERLRQKAHRHLLAVVRECFSRHRDNCDWETVENALTDGVPDFFEHELGEILRGFSDQVAQTLSPRQEGIDDLAESIREAASGIFDIAHQKRERSATFAMTRPPHWVSHEWSATLGAIPADVFDRLLPQPLRQSRLRKRVMAQVEALVVRNVENLRWALLQDLDDLFRRFRSDIDARFEDTRSATLGAIRAAKTQRAERQDLVAKEIVRLQFVEADLQGIGDRLLTLIPR